MKKWLSAALILVFLAVISSYIFVPSKITISKITIIKCLPGPTAGFLLNGESWQKWLPQASMAEIEQHLVSYKNYSYLLARPFFNQVQIEIKQNSNRYVSKISIIPIVRDSSVIHWETSFTSSKNPIKRVTQYFNALALKENMTDILEHLKGFLEQNKNVYGFEIKKTTFGDTLLMTTKVHFPTYPNTREVYNIIDNLRTYISLKGGVTTGNPMIHIQQEDSTDFRLMAALPINKNIEEDKNHSIIMMMHRKENFISANVWGGPETIKKAYQQIENYMSDHMLTAPAIPFEILITDRSKVTDTSKWITVIYYPTT